MWLKIQNWLVNNLAFISYIFITGAAEFVCVGRGDMIEGGGVRSLKLTRSAVPHPQHYSTALTKCANICVLRRTLCLWSCYTTFDDLERIYVIKLRFIRSDLPHNESIIYLCSKCAKWGEVERQSVRSPKG